MMTDQFDVIRSALAHLPARGSLQIPGSVDGLVSAPQEVAGVTLTEVTTDRVAAHMHVSEQHVNARGGVQGGMVVVLADAAGGWATSILAGVDGYATADVKGNLMRSASLGDVLTATARVRHRGRRTVIVSVDVATDVTRAGAAPYQALVGTFLITQIVHDEAGTDDVSEGER